MESVKSSARNPHIELCRFIAALVIVFHHTEKLGGYGFFAAYRIARGGWVFVEFFFILSGYFMTRHFENSPDRSLGIPEKAAFAYTVKKLLKIMPYAAAGICLDAVAQIGCGDIDVLNIGSLIAELPAHFLFLYGLGFLKYDINAPLWYLTGILVAMPLLAAMLLRFRSFYKYLGWILPLFIYAALVAVHGSIPYWVGSWSIHSMFRAFAGLMLGSVSFYLSEYMKTLHYTRNMRVLLSALEAILFLALVLLSFSTDCMANAFPCILFCFVSLCIAFSGQENLHALVPKQALFLGKLSIPMYCLHRPVFDLVRWLCEGLTLYTKLLIAVITLFVLSCSSIMIISRVTASKNRTPSV